MKSFAFVIATLNGENSVAKAVSVCSRQAPTYVVSDGSTDRTEQVARQAGATDVLPLTENVGKPAAIYTMCKELDLLSKYDLICIVDDDTVIDENFVTETTKHFKDDVVVVCAKTKSDWNEQTRWNPIVAARAFAYWKYQTFIRRGQSALGVMNCISGSNSVYTSKFLSQVLRPDTPYAVDDTYWVLEAHRRNLGKVVYAPYTSAKIQEPTTVKSWYKQNLRWMWGTMQGIAGHRVGTKFTKFDIAYLGMILDWILYVLVMPVLLGIMIVVNRDSPDRLLKLLMVYLIGYLVWSVIGALALKKWRLVPLFPMLIAIDWICRVNFVHAFIKTCRQPTSSCRWVSPERYEQGKEG